MPVTLKGSSSGQATIQAAATAANNTLTLPSGNGMLVGQSTTTAPTNGQIPIGNGTDYTPATITAGTGITVTNGAGSITIAASGGAGTVTSITAGTGLSGGTITTTGTIALDFYTGTTSTNTSYPIGSYLIAVDLNSAVNNNTASTLYISSSFIVNSASLGGSAITGTWRKRGGPNGSYPVGCNSIFISLYQRVA